MTSDYFVLLMFLLASLSSFIFTIIVDCAKLKPRTEKDVIKDCNGIQYRFMADGSIPPFPKIACDIKQKVIECFEHKENNLSGTLLDKDRFLLLQSSVVDRALMCPNLNYRKLPNIVHNSAIAQELLSKYPIALPNEPEVCAVNIHRYCEKKIFDQVVINHRNWPITTKWRQCYEEKLEDAKKNSTCSPLLTLQNYATLQKEFGESLRQLEYEQKLYGRFMNDHHNQNSLEIL